MKRLCSIRIDEGLENKDMLLFTFKLRQYSVLNGSLLDSKVDTPSCFLHDS